MKRFFVLVAMLVMVSACSPDPETVTIKETVIAEIPITVQVMQEVTKIVEITREVEVTNIIEVIVTATYTSTPLMSPTPSGTPTITPTPSNTPTETVTPDIAATVTVKAFVALTKPHGNGFYLVNVDIAPGLWRSTGIGSNCYWARRDSNQNILDNHYGDAGGTVRIRPSDFEIEFNGCGQWEYLGP